MSKRIYYLGTLVLVASVGILGTTVGARPLAADDDSGISRSEMGRLDLFLDSHPDIAKTVEANPALATNKEFLASHPEWRSFLEDHADIRQGLTANASAFMRGEDRFDAAEAKSAPAAKESMGNQLRSFDGFLDQHPAIAKQLEVKPSLINDKKYLEAHPELVAFLKNNAAIRDSIASNPQGFIKGIAAVDAADTPAAPPKPASGGTSASSGGNPTMPPTKAPANNDAATKSQITTVDDFLDANRSLANQLEAKPWLVNNTEFLKDNPKLVSFLKDNPVIRDKWRADPALMIAELRRVDQLDVAKNPHLSGEAQVKSDMASFEDFLDRHAAVAKQLEANPSLIRNQDYLEDHPELVAFLKDNAGIREALLSRPQAFMKGVEAANAAEANPPAPKPTMPPTKAPAPPEAENDGLNRSQIVALDTFLDANPGLAKQLEAKPALINDSSFVKDNPDLASFLQNHPDLAQDWRDKAALTMTDLRRMDQLEAARAIGNERDVDVRSAAESFDNFLDNHPVIAAEIGHHSSLSGDVAFIDAHPELKAYLQKNPGVAAELRSNPQSFMNLVSTLDRQDTPRTEKKEDLKPTLALSHK